MLTPWIGLGLEGSGGGWLRVSSGGRAFEHDDGRATGGGGALGLMIGPGGPKLPLGMPVGRWGGLDRGFPGPTGGCPKPLKLSLTFRKETEIVTAKEGQCANGAKGAPSPLVGEGHVGIGVERLIAIASGAAVESGAVMRSGCREVE